MNCSLPGSFVHGIFQVRILEWVAISYPRGSSQSWDLTSISCISCIGRQILYHCATWEAPIVCVCTYILISQFSCRSLILWLPPGQGCSSHANHPSFPSSCHSTFESSLLSSSSLNWDSPFPNEFPLF